MKAKSVQGEAAGVRWGCGAAAGWDVQNPGFLEGWQGQGRKEMNWMGGSKFRVRISPWFRFGEDTFPFFSFKSLENHRRALPDKGFVLN